MISASIAEHTIGPSLDMDLHNVNWDQLAEFFCYCYYRKRSRRPIPDIPSDEIWIQLSNPDDWGTLSLHPQQETPIQETVPVPLLPLEQQLLLLGGKRMVYRYEPDIEALLERGKAFHGPRELIPGEARECHSNVAWHWEKQKEKRSIVTGYALSMDGLWRQHSWLVQKQQECERFSLLETTMERLQYFGFLLTDQEAEHFHKLYR
ncbi:hypothetical protein KSX_67970 [Ktedonospora formicarum]|uniref:Uncharacterized protein n=2 Tax=Ktedonospora formicarum TaxID=2778364 RepID=A0A8J3IAT6_9CHLR|nr:hypothetical protein KSX_67970 [Ktedonospora formicarum]